MADEVTEQNVPADLDIENMKVVDLKRKLKEFGLSSTGNKPELVERLQAVMASEKGKDLSSDPDTDIPDSNETSVDTQLEDSSTLLDDFSFSSPEKECISFECSNTSSISSTPNVMPLKKRAVAQNASEIIVKVERKRIKLNRNNIPTPKFEPNKPVEQVEITNLKKQKFTNVVFDDKSDDPKKDSIKNVGAEIDEVNTDASGKIIHLSTKRLTEDEKISLRAKRFNITAPEPISKSGKVAVSVKKDQISVKSGSASVVASAADLNVLKKRAERFGESVSSKMKQLEDQQKVLKRVSKFGAVDISNVVTSVEEQEKKRKRAERFGL